MITQASATNHAKPSQTDDQLVTRPSHSAETLTSLHRLQPDNPLRPLDWRWRLANHLVHGGWKPPWKIDAHVQNAMRFSIRLEECRDGRDHQELRSMMPAVYDARDIFVAEPKSLRWELEARLLSRDPLETIAAKMGLSLGIVEEFESLFFNVLDRLDSPSWITHIAIGPKVQHGLVPDNHRTLWALYAYHGGPLVLDELVRDVSALSQPENASEVDGYLREEIRATVTRRATIAIRCLSLDDPKVALKLIRISLWIREMDARRLKKVAGYDNRCGNLEVTLAHLDRIWGKGARPWYEDLQIVVNPSGNAQESPGA